MAPLTAQYFLSLLFLLYLSPVVLSIDLSHHLDRLYSLSDSIDIILASRSSSSVGIEGNEDIRQESAGRDDASKRQLFELPTGGASKLPHTKYGFNDTCNNKICSMYQTALSCKTIGINLSKLCASYFLGYVFDCPIFPSPNEVFEAPYACIMELKSSLTPVLTKISSGGGSISDVFSSYLSNLNSQGCHRNCYQTYINQSLDFYDTCGKALDTAPYNTTYPVAFNLEKFVDFRGQNCVENSDSKNCFGLIYQKKIESQESTTKINLLDPTCQYSAFTDQYPASYRASLVSAVMSGACSTISGWGCCYANQINMIAMAQVNETGLEFFPPCLLRYLTLSCPALNPINFCSNGSNTNMSVVATGTITLKSIPTVNKLPNVYDITNYNVVPSDGQSVLYLQGVIATAFTSAGIYTVDPLSVEILSYTYYNSSTMTSKHQTSTVSGLPPYPAEADYSTASAGVFSYAVVIPGISPEVAAVLRAKATGTIVGLGSYLNIVCNKAFYSTFTGDCTAAVDGGVVTYGTSQFITHKNSASRAIRNDFVISAAVAVLITCIYFIVI